MNRVQVWAFLCACLSKKILLLIFRYWPIFVIMLFGFCGVRNLWQVVLKNMWHNFCMQERLNTCLSPSPPSHPCGLSADRPACPNWRHHGHLQLRAHRYWAGHAGKAHAPPVLLIQVKKHFHPILTIRCSISGEVIYYLHSHSCPVLPSLPFFIFAPP